MEASPPRVAETRINADWCKPDQLGLQASSAHERSRHEQFKQARSHWNRCSIA
jgi:hypothetical protein